MLRDQTRLKMLLELRLKQLQRWEIASRNRRSLSVLLAHSEALDLFEISKFRSLALHSPHFWSSSSGSGVIFVVSVS